MPALLRSLLILAALGLPVHSAFAQDPPPPPEVQDPPTPTPTSTPDPTPMPTPEPTPTPTPEPTPEPAWPPLNPAPPPARYGELLRGPGDTLRLSLCFEFDLDYVQRSAEIMDVRGSFATNDTVGSAGTMEYEYRMRLIGMLWKNVQFEMLFRNNRLTPTTESTLGAPSPSALRLHDMNVTFSAWLGFPELSMTMGAQPFDFDLRGRGQAFFFDPYHSESAGFDANALNPTSFPDTQQPSGFVWRWEQEEFQIGVAALPAIDEGGKTGNDESAYAATFFYNLGPRSRAGAMASIHATPGGRTRVLTVGGGVTYHELHPGLELYAEFYFQRGSVGRIIFSGKNEDVEAQGIGFQLGARYQDGPWFGELNFTHLSGDDDVNDKEDRRFQSYENVRDLLILESSIYGIDLDTNLTLIKLMGGYTVMPGLDVMAAVGLAGTLNEKAPYNPILSGREDGIGTEVDVTARYQWTRRVAFHGGLGLLTGADLIQNVTGETSTASLLFIGMTVKM